MNRLTRRGIFFDLDGTLADSKTALCQVFRDFAASCGRETTDADYDALQGPAAPGIGGIWMKAAPICFSATTS